MVAFREDSDVYPVLIALSTCANDELAKSGLDPVAYTTIQPSAVPTMDYVGNGKDCAEMILNVTLGYPVTGAALQQDVTGSCATTPGFDIQLGLFRCAPPMVGTKTNPRPPTPATWLNAERVVLADMAAMRRAIQCCMQTTERDYVLRNWQPYGPSGMAMGGVWTVTVGGN